MENVLKGLKKSLPERYHHLLPINEKAIEKGLGKVETVREV
jgi:2-oxoglutarate ferredoxin oxidoreductase subunit gamma